MEKHKTKKDFANSLKEDISKMVVQGLAENFQDFYVERIDADTRTINWKCYDNLNKIENSGKIIITVLN